MTPTSPSSTPSRRTSILVLVGFLAAAFTAAAVGGQFLPGEWYAGLDKPRWNPPNWIFGPVWTVLYALMGIAAWLVWREARDTPSKGSAVRPALAVWTVQLVLNAAWSWLFFGLHRPDLAFGEILLLWLAILVTLVLFWRLRVLAGALLVPYLAWVSFAALLNLTLWRMNAG